MKIISIVVLSCMSLAVTAQTDYNKWSIGGNIGIHDGMSPTVAQTRAFQLHHFGGDIRYMANNRVGIMGDVAYEFFDFYNKDYNTNYFRVSLQGVVNAGDLLRFSTFTNRFGLFLHGGFGFSTMWQNTDVRDSLRSNNLINDQGIKGNDDMLNFIFGVKPQFKISERWALTADLAFIFHANQTYDFAMQKKSNHGSIDGFFNTISIGATYYIGKHKTHADWTPTIYGESTDNSDLINRLAAMEEALKDNDNDGVPNGRDAEPNTPANSYVNSKGEAIVEKVEVDLDKDKDGFLDSVDECPEIAGRVNGCPDRDGDGIPDEKDACPDEFGTAELQGCALSKEDLQVVKTASESIYFNTGKAVIKSESFSELDKLAKILVDHPEVSAKIEGHTDDTGNNELNLNLSKERAAEVRNYLVKKGVAAERLSSEGFGSTRPTATNDTEEGRTQNRRVKIIISSYTVKSQEK